MISHMILLLSKTKTFVILELSFSPSDMEWIVLRKKVHDLSSVEITGLRGQPLYAKGLLEEGKYSTDRQILSIQLNEVEPLPVETEAMGDDEMRGTGTSFPEDIEVWVGGSLQSSFRRDSFTVKAKSSHDDVLMLMVCFPGCYVFMKTKWTNVNNNEQKIGETLARLVGDNCGLFEFLADPSKTHCFAIMGLVSMRQGHTLNDKLTMQWLWI